VSVLNGVALAERRDGLAVSGAAAFGAAFLGLIAVLSPPLAIVGAGAALFATIAVRNLAAGLAVFTVLTFFDRTTALSEAALSPVKLAGMVLAVIWVVLALNRSSGTPMLAADFPGFVAATVLLSAWSLASALWAPDRILAASTAFRLALSAVLVFIVYAAIQERRHVRWLVWSFIIGVFFAQVIGFLHLYPSSNDGRLSGGFDDPNELASVDVTGMVLAAFAFVAARGRTIRWVFLPAAALFGLALIGTDSQAGVLAMGVALVLSLVFSGRARRLAVTAVAALLLVATFYYTIVTAPVLLETITSSQNVGARESLWAVATQATKDHPVVGVGAGNFPVVSASYTLSDLNLPRADAVLQGHIVHNTYLEVLTELGPIGLLLFMSVIAYSLWLGVVAVRQFERAGEWELEMLTRGIVIGTAAMLTASIFATATYEKQLWLLFALAPALAGLARRSLRASERRARQSPPALEEQLVGAEP
jgi:putative inorganic carbon (hco3(-)) transporter